MKHWIMTGLLVAGIPVSCVAQKTLPSIKPDSVDFAGVPCDIVAAVAGDIMDGRQMESTRALAMSGATGTYRTFTGLAFGDPIPPKVLKLFRQIVDEAFTLPPEDVTFFTGKWKGRCEHWPKRKTSNGPGTRRPRTA